jgi:hypothetical protein
MIMIHDLKHELKIIHNLNLRSSSSPKKLLSGKKDKMKESLILVKLSMLINVIKACSGQSTELSGYNIKL